MTVIDRVVVPLGARRVPPQSVICRGRIDTGIPQTGISISSSLIYDPASSRETSMIIANIEDYRKQCGARLPRFLYDYISGGSYQENTLRANIAELQGTLLRQRVMVDESHLNLSIRLWDQALSLPVVPGPVGMAGMYSSRGEVKAANAAKAVGVPFTLSTMGVCDVHEVAQKTGVPP
jgi:L-lactate dehydrogenase (cytochrome)